MNVKANSKFFRKLGALKVYSDVSRYYLSLVQFILIGAGFIKYMEYDTVVIVIVCISFPIVLSLVTYCHVKYIMPNEYIYHSLRNPATMQILKNTGNGKIEY